MSRWTKTWLVLAFLFFLFFCFGITEVGQQFLRGDTSKITDHWKLDDIYMGAGLTPLVYGLIPSLVLVMAGFSNWADRQRKK